jgi:stage II sporulation protein Q
MNNGKSFAVVAALGGTVTQVKEDAVLGNVIEVEHSKGVVTQYQSVKDIAVKEGDVVKQGQFLAKAGQSELNKQAGTHLHFEIRKNDVAVNPVSYFNKTVSDVEISSKNTDENAADSQGSGESKQNQATEDTSTSEENN